MTTPPDIEKLVKRARAANSNLGATCADALQSQAARVKSLEEQCEHRAQHQLRQSQRISDLEAELDLANKQIVETGRAWTVDRSALEAQVEAFREALGKFLGARRHNILGEPAGWCISGRDSLNEAEAHANALETQAARVKELEKERDALSKSLADSVAAYEKDMAEDEDRIANLEAQLEAFREAARPFINFRKSLLEWRNGDSVIQSGWERHTAVLDRTYPTEGSDDCITRVSVFASDFDALMAALKKKKA